MSKSADAFRTISEVAEWLETPAHVLRFWESKFSQVRPVKRAGGRRYYRPADMELLGGIKRLLHEEGMTIKGVQKLLRDRGTSHVAAMSPPLEDLAVPLEAEIVQLKPRKAPTAATEPAPLPAAPEVIPTEALGKMTPPDGSEAGPLAAGSGEGAIVAGHGTEPPSQGTEEPGEEVNLFSDLETPDTAETDAPEAGAIAAVPEPAAQPLSRPVIPEDPEDDAIDVAPGVLARLAARSAPLPAAQAARAVALARRLPGLG
ncbi:MerR family transcriptional regulator [Oceanicola sp. S124]|uniref:MerR family transcriptional regulator n=1 Tax=Oceanicola sp. S124 TaxID=1042378 RepID=UPI000255818C|nr:MerR family transcriptional regulator [Oceanicola sp. S124]